jgi:cation diffusion facilitator CzcD-associated flavoprotein CzcO
MTLGAQPRAVETAVIGAGQTGLAMSWLLRQAGREHVVLERRPTLGGGWQAPPDGNDLRKNQGSNN